MERTCVIIKPDGVGKKVVGEVIRRLEKEDLKLIGITMARLDAENIKLFYEVHKGKDFFEPLVNFLLSGPIVVTAWQGPGAVKRVRTLIGDTNSKEASPGTLRRSYGTDNRRNLVHASDSIENGMRETAFFFPDSSLHEYDENEWKKW